MLYNKCISILLEAVEGASTCTCFTICKARRYSVFTLRTMILDIMYHSGLPKSWVLSDFGMGLHFYSSPIRQKSNKCLQQWKKGNVIWQTHTYITSRDKQYGIWNLGTFYCRRRSSIVHYIFHKGVTYCVTDVEYFICNSRMSWYSYTKLCMASEMERVTILL